MKNRGRLTATALVAALILTLIPVAAQAADATYHVYDDGDLFDVLDDLENGDTIIVEADFTYGYPFIIDGISVTLNVGSHTLTVDNSGYEHGLRVCNNGVLTLVGSGGAFNVIGDLAGVCAESGGKATVTNAAASGLEMWGAGVFATGTGSTVTVLEDTAGSGDYCNGAFADNGGVITVGGDATADGSHSVGAYAGGANSEVTVAGSVQGAALGVCASFGGAAAVGGGVTATEQEGMGAYAVETDSVINVTGGVTVTNSYSTAVFAYGGGVITVGGNATASMEGSRGVYAVDTGSEVTVTGSVQAIGCGVFAVDGGSITAGSVTSSGEFTEGAEAMGAGSIITLSGDVSATGNNSAGASAEGGGVLTVSGSVTAAGDNAVGVSVKGEDSRITVSGSVQGVSYGAYAVGEMGQGGSGPKAPETGTVMVAGNITATGEEGIGAYAVDKGVITAGGKVTAKGANGVGAMADAGGSVTINGAIDATGYIRIGSAKKSEYPTDGAAGEGANLGYFVYTDVNNAGSVVRVKINITGLPGTYAMFSGGRVTWEPLPDGGEWGWDPAFFSATFNSPATFTALQAGTSVITYTFGGVTQSVTVTVQATALPVTGQDFTPAAALLALAVGSCAAALVLRRAKARGAAR